MTEAIAPVTAAPAADGQGAAPSAAPSASSVAPNAASTATSQLAPAATPATWYDGFDPDMKGWMENKGLTKVDAGKALEMALTGHRNIEKYMGVPAEKLLRLPDFDKADKAEMDQFYGKLGRPADANGYEIPVPQGMPTDFAEAAKAKFHELGLTAKQAKALAEWNNEYAAQVQSGMSAQHESTIKAQQDALRREWGQAYDQNDVIAGKVIDAAARAGGLSPDDLKAMTNALGFDKTMKMFAGLGVGLGEHGFVDGGSASSGIMTPAAAKAQIKQLTNDQDFLKQRLAGNQEANAKWRRLHEMAIGA